VAQIEVYEVLRFVGDKGTEVAPYDTVPSGAFSLVELEAGQYLYCSSNVRVYHTVFLMCIAISYGGVCQFPVLDLE
jgi:hypothetical protein